ncbi:MAG: hypothetical protein COW58_03775 [Thalassolituus sp. CG17_big_fil_post_rev_8_21_14_2_50_53_8]|nr:MAG: hypothetical protein COW58_03775 [Thalassolituus sp. CG17_big_fil_post_rev_8_21_14_2_50_53_8]
MFIPYPKVALYIASGPDGDDEKKHLFVIITAPVSKKDDDILMVNFSTVYDGAHYDEACIVEPGEHKFIKQKSFVYYKFARIESAKDIEKLINNKSISVHQESISDDLFNKITSGLLTSDEVSQDILDFYKSRVK